MAAFSGLQARAAVELQRLGLETIVWRWDARGWSAEAPNAGRRWVCAAGVDEGRGATGEEAFGALVAALERRAL